MVLCKSARILGLVGYCDNEGMDEKMELKQIALSQQSQFQECIWLKITTTSTCPSLFLFPLHHSLILFSTLFFLTRFLTCFLTCFLTRFPLRSPAPKLTFKSRKKTPIIRPIQMRFHDHEYSIPRCRSGPDRRREGREEEEGCEEFQGGGGDADHGEGWAWAFWGDAVSGGCYVM